MNNRISALLTILCLLGLSAFADAQIARGRIRGQRQAKVVDQIQLAGSLSRSEKTSGLSDLRIK
jgi:hypothetical protein